MEEGTSNQPVSNQSSPNKGSSKVLVVIIVILVVLGVGGYFVSRYVARKIADKAASTLLGAATGGQVKVDSSNNSVKVSNGNGTLEVNGATWPSDIPAPKYSGGKIDASSKFGTGADQTWTVTISGTTKDQFDIYNKDLTAAGWTSVGTTQFGATINQYTKDSYDLTATFDPSSNGVSLTVTVKQ